MHLFHQGKVEAAAKEMLRDDTNNKTLRLLTVVRVGSPDYEAFKTQGRIAVKVIEVESARFVVFLN